MHCRPLAAAAALVLSQTSLAQGQSAPSAGEQKLERVEVTGSRLRRADIETPSPVQVISSDEIVRSGAVTLNELLQKLPANNVGAQNEANTVDNYGAAAVSLRGLGPGSTLVLINGRRVAPFGFTGGATFVDINQIPVIAIERVEVLLDGASAIYGSDAVAGVVNVILRRDYRGIEVAAGVGRSTHGDATQRQASLTFGIGDRIADGYNVFASFSHSDQDAVKARARWHSQSGDYRAFGLPDFRSASIVPGQLVRDQQHEPSCSRSRHARPLAKPVRRSPADASMTSRSTRTSSSTRGAMRCSSPARRTSAAASSCSATPRWAGLSFPASTSASPSTSYFNNSGPCPSRSFVCRSAIRRIRIRRRSRCGPASPTSRSS